jgi:acid stress-induced BolA-like protein IbaG/YrbA
MTTMELQSGKAAIERGERVSARNEKQMTRTLRTMINKILEGYMTSAKVFAFSIKSYSPSICRKMMIF